MEYNDSVSQILWETLKTHSIISHTFVQRKFKVNFTTAIQIICEFNKREVIPLHKWHISGKYRDFTCKSHVQNLENKNKERKTMIVTVGGTKGGIGKSTLATNIVAIHVSKGKRVLFVDADEQKSSSTFIEHRQNLKIPTPWKTEKQVGMNVAHEVRKVMHNYDEVVIDVGARDTIAHRAAVLVSDIYIIPFKPGFYDVETVEDVRRIIETNRVTNPNLKVFAMLNQADFRGETNDQVLEELRKVDYITTVLKTVIRNRVSIRNCVYDGLCIIETKNKDLKAIQEITSFYSEIYGEDTNGIQKKSPTI